MGSQGTDHSARNRSDIMLQDKRKDLDSERQKKLLQRLVEELSRTQPDLYYQATSTIALLLEAHIQRGAGLSLEERELLHPLRKRDIEILLSLH